VKAHRGKFLATGGALSVILLGLGLFMLLCSLLVAGTDLRIILWMLSGASILVSVVVGIPTRICASKDLREMEAGTMDPSGRGLTKAARVCGLVASLVVWVAVTVLGFGLVVTLILLFL
jgi:hypothetical protein